ncbi:MAG: DUF192 domain-containing protein [Candidatus Jacksonbacteria bacterium]|jgi:uncharacterized protein|nr:DUF192 domain-containing protein [Candidatus Jacksonbacteria bacterium]MBT6034093.1 DUF192 domain-containing protein [Candidatus Jacksonbacteria bacterium]MBT6301128.1 DUF192 domain-containing protein [Candidatus Jacksonbacteria bacterium]MBT6757289.1 DUF192 domain-containing protein [Candidatus Jacksonbacteria bacterium]MBT6955630.1 DUF192 domain-containing protein [Candidatus Jacksonbacteria bacterium]
MILRKHLEIFIAIIILVVAGIVIAFPKRSIEFNKEADVLRPVTPAISLPELESNQARVYIGGEILVVNVARTNKERMTGLLEHAVLEEDSGMLFEFDGYDEYNFHMQAMKFPIDIIWLDNETIIDITPKAPPQAAEGEKVLYSPVVPVNRVLEVVSGFTEAHKLFPGDTIAIEFE